MGKKQCTTWAEFIDESCAIRYNKMSPLLGLNVCKSFTASCIAWSKWHLLSIGFLSSARMEKQPLRGHEKSPRHPVIYT